MKVAVVGATGFVGSALVRACRKAGHDVRPVHSPRLSSTAISSTELAGEAQAVLQQSSWLRTAAQGVDVLVNAAGVPDALAGEASQLHGPNALLPVVLAIASRDADVQRFVHVSSAAVQGRLAVLDESPKRTPFSPYSRSKVWAEEALEAMGGPIVIYRPTSVHGMSRQVTRELVTFAEGPLSSVAGSGLQPTPQILVESVGSAIAHIVGADAPPTIVMHPWEGITTSDLLYWLSGRHPRRIPTPAARAAVGTAKATGFLHGAAAGVARRLEMLWFGQAQARSWLTADGWKSSTVPSDWELLGKAIRGLPTRSR